MKTLSFILLHTFCLYFTLLLVNAKLDFSDLQAARGWDLLRIISYDIFQIALVSWITWYLMTAVVTRFGIRF